MNTKKSQLFEKKSHNMMRYEKVNRLKQLGFTTSWNINEQKKDYNALQDPNADRYFKYQSVKAHIKQLKRSLGKSEINESQRKRMTRLIKQKLADRLPAIKVAAETYNISTNELDRSQVSQSLKKQKSLSEVGKSKKNKHKKRHNKTSNQRNVPSDRNTQLETHQKEGQRKEENQQKQKVLTKNNLVGKSQRSLKEDKKQGEKKQIEKKQIEKKQQSRKQKQMLHRVKHEQFISFIAKKREALQPVKNSPLQVQVVKSSD